MSLHAGCKGSRREDAVDPATPQEAVDLIDAIEHSEALAPNLLGGWGGIFRR